MGQTAPLVLSLHQEQAKDLRDRLYVGEDLDIGIKEGRLNRKVTGFEYVQ